MKLSRRNISAICAAQALRGEIASEVRGEALLALPLDDLSARDFEELYGLAVDAWRNEAPVVERYTAEQDLGPYPVLIRGVPGAYFVSALEFEDEGPFSTLRRAREVVRLNHGEFSLQGPIREP